MSDPPVALILICGALLAPFISGRVKSFILVLLPLWCLVLIYQLPQGSLHTLDFLGMQLIITKVDGLSRVFGLGFSLAFLLGIIYGLKQSNLEHCSALVYAGGALGVTFAGDWFTLYLYWELMAVASTFLILAADSSRARQAALRYVLMHLAGGLLLLAGILLRYQATGSLALDPLELKGTANWLIFLGVGLNAAVPLLHTWLPDAYAKASVTGSVFLCAFTTKSAVYVLARVFAGNEFLIYLGGIMAVLPILYALVSDDYREVLSYSLISQIGYMVAGIGIGSQLALNGVSAHAFCHLIYKALLFMGAGAILKCSGRRRLSSMGALAAHMPLTAICSLVGLASICALPLFSGFVSKSMILTEAGNLHLTIPWLLLQLASAGAMLYLGLRVPYYAFIRPNPDISADRPPMNMQAAMVMAALVCIGLAVFPGAFYKLLPYSLEYHPYNPSHLTEALQMLGFGAVAFVVLKISGLLPEPQRVLHLDFDVFYRKIFAWLFKLFDKGLNGLNQVTANAVEGKITAGICRHFKSAPTIWSIWIAKKFWTLGGLDQAEQEQNQKSIRQALATDTLAAGMGALACLLIVFLLFILA